MAAPRASAESGMIRRPELGDPFDAVLRALALLP
jgi:hypothetical protein